MSDKGPDCKFNTRTEAYWVDAVERAIAADPHLGDIPWNFVMACPRCGHDLQKQISEVPIFKVYDENDEPETIIVSCNCSNKHDGSSGNEGGCGNAARFLAPWKR